MKNPLAIHPTVKLMSEKISEMPWGVYETSKLYIATRDLMLTCTWMERRAIHIAHKKSRALANEANYFEAQRLILGGEYAEDRFRAQVKVLGGLNAATQAQQAVTQNAAYNGQVRLGGQGTVGALTQEQFENIYGLKIKCD